MDRTERMEIIEAAITLVEEAMDMVNVAVEDTVGENHYKAYGKYGFDNLLGNGNPYDYSLNDLINPRDENDIHPLEQIRR